RRIHEAVGDAHIAAGVDVHAVAIGIDLEIVDGQIVDAVGENAEMAAVENREIAQDDVVAVLEADGLIADAGIESAGAATAAAQALAPNAAGADDARVRDVLGPDQAVVKM